MDLQITEKAFTMTCSSRLFFGGLTWFPFLWGNLWVFSGKVGLMKS